MLKLLLFISFVPTILGCGLLESTIGDLLTFQVDKKTNLNLEASYTSIINRQVSLPVSISTDFAEELKSRGAELDSFSDILISGIQMEIKTPDGKNFNFLKDITFDIDDEVIASLTEIPSDQNPIQLNTTNYNVLSLVKNDNLSMEMTFEFLETIPEDYTIEITFNFDVKANVL